MLIVIKYGLKTVFYVSEKETDKSRALRDDHYSGYFPILSSLPSIILCILLL